MGIVEFDMVLTRAAGPGVLADVVAMTSHRTIWAQGVAQSGSSHYQFHVELDVPAQEWRMVTSDGREYAFGEGVLTLALDPPRPAQFPAGMPPPVRMLYPAQLLTWGRGPESFHPVLVQEIGSHSMLLTFEHKDDPAFRTTMVIDRELGVIRKTILLEDLTIFTDIVTEQPLPRLDPIEFPPITDSIRIDY